MRTTIRNMVWMAVTLSLGMMMTPAGAQDTRTWTAKSGHKVEATLVKYSDYEITIKLGSGEEKVIARDQFAAEDIAYLKKFPKLRKKEKPKKMPFLRTEAVVSSRARDTQFSRDHEARKKFTIEVSSREQEKKDIVVRYIWVAKPTRKGTHGPDSMLYFGKREKKLTVLPQSSATFETNTGTAASHPGYELTGIIVQTYWDGFLIDHFTSVGSLSSIARDETLWKRAR